MCTQGLEVIDHTVQLTHEWINELRDRLDWSSSRDALRILRVTLVHIRDHFSHAEVAQLAAQMPLLVRGMFFEGRTPPHTRQPDRRAESFLAGIEAHISEVQDRRGREDVEAVFRMLDNRISDGEIADVKASLLAHIRDFWPD